jgi:hypothetical protein
MDRAFVVVEKPVDVLHSGDTVEGMPLVVSGEFLEGESVIWF